MSKTIANCAIWFDGQAIASSVNQVSVESSADMIEVTTLADLGKRRIGGLKDSTISASGFWEATEPDATLFGDIAKAVPITVATAHGSVGSTAFVLNALAGSYGPNGAVGAALGFSVKGAGTDRLGQGVLALNGTVTADGASAVYQLPAIPAGGRLVTALHLVSAVGGGALSAVVKSANNAGMTGATTRATFAPAGAVGAQLLEVAGPIADTYWQLEYTVTGTGPAFIFAAPVAVAF